MQRRFNLSPYEVARAYWAIPLKERTYKRLATVLQLEDRSINILNQLGRLVNQWEDQGHVRHVVFPEFGVQPAYLPRDTELEDRMREHFGLRGVVVVDVSLLYPDGDPQTNPAGWNEYDDQIHQHLGLWASRVLMAVIRPADILGTGGGRGPYYTAMASRPSSWAMHYPQQVVSLTGQMITHPWSTGPSRWSLDADGIASLLSHVFATKIQPRRLDRPITEKTGDPPLNTEDVTVALVGIGALAGRHRLLEHSTSEDLKKASRELTHLNGLIKKADPAQTEGPPFHHWIGDVCNHLFVVDDAVSPRALGPKKRESLDQAVKAVNDLFLNTETKALIDIAKRNVVIAVAGGPHKVGPIAHVLQQSNGSSPWITHLVTDMVVARYILGQMRAPSPSK